MRNLLLILAFICCHSTFSQGFKVKEFQENLQDGSAFRAPMDAEGNPCGLIKVQSNCTGLTFGNNIVGEVENKTNEYWVYLPKGSKQLVVKHPNFMPLLIEFQTYGINEVASKTTYILTLNELKYNKEKNGLVVTTKPAKATLYVDDVLIENLKSNGFYQLYLPKGDHICRVDQAGYRPYVQAVSIGKATQNLNVELESVLAELEIKCKTKTAELYVDCELKGNGVWKGEILAGEHLIEAKQRNYESTSQRITLAEKESRMFVIPELKRSMGRLTINSTPKEVPIVVDGKQLGLTPCSIDLESGKHYISCEAYGCTPYRKNVEIEEGVTKLETITLDYINDEYKKAYQGDKDAMHGLTILSWRTNIYERKEYEEALFWRERLERHHLLESDELNDADYVMYYSIVDKPEKAVSLYNSVPTDESLKFEILGCISDAFMRKQEYDQAIIYLKKIVEEGVGVEEKGVDGINGAYKDLGECYSAKGDKQQALYYYRKYLNVTRSYDTEALDEVRKKIRELEK